MKKLFSVISLIACMTMILCGCGNWEEVDSVKIQSIQSGSDITFKMSGISGDLFPEGEEGRTYYYSDEKSKEEMLSELKEKNDDMFFTENGFDFIRVPNVEGVYFLNIYQEQVKLPDRIVNRTSVRIDDMSCSLFTGSRHIDRFPFPYFMLQTTEGTKIGDTYNAIALESVGLYQCDGSELLNLVKTLGVWEVEEKENSFVMSFKGNKVEVVCGGGTVTLQPVSQ